MALSLYDIAKIIKEASFDQLVGKTEGQFLDAKEQPNNLNSGGDDAKRELAKDISAFANASGGYILIGFQTDKFSLQATEQLSAPRPIPMDLFDGDQYLKILSNWLYPAPKGVIAEWVSYGGDPEKGIAFLFVPSQDDRLKPFLITSTRGDKKSTSVTLGYVERRLDATEVRSVQDLHHALRTGLFLERELLGRIESLESAVQRHFAVGEHLQSEEERKRRLAERTRQILDDFGEADE